MLLISAIAGTVYPPVPVRAQEGAVVPTVPWQNTVLPDWNQISLQSLPPIRQSGSFDAPPEMVQQLGYDPSRAWQAGQTPDEYLKLGDIEAFRLQDLSLIQIASAAGLDLNGLSLESFGLIGEQTLASLVEALPDLKERAIARVQPVLDLLQAHLTTAFDPSQTIGEFLEASPHLGELGFDALALDAYRFTDLPQIEQISLSRFQHWQNGTIAGVPGLSELPMGQFPVPPRAVGSDVGQVDIAFQTAERQRDRAISGSDVEGFSVPCAIDYAQTLGHRVG
ncbi:hypothetical protein [Lusitaniella coriacea]|uniref:hypothetical protein n=1 Tax=Lusitaniella coriacea TaxID=1983105 RepID=UPI003CF69EEA